MSNVENGNRIASFTTCGILFSGYNNEFEDVTGCLKRHAHNDFHVCQTKDKKLMAWKDDETCNCGCWDEETPCILYWPVNEI